MIRLFIEGKELDITEGFSHQITYAVDDLNNLDSKSTSFSKTIILPGTAKNNILLGNIFEFANSNFTGLGENVGYNFNASRSAKCRLDINGLTIIKGGLRLLEIVRDGDSIEYEVAIFGELGSFFSKLSNKRLEDLDFGMYNHIYNDTNIQYYWKDATDLILYTDIDTVIVNMSPDYFADIYQDLRDYFTIGDNVEFFDYYSNTAYGVSDIINIVWDGVKTTLYFSTPFTSPPGSSFKAKIVNYEKKGFGVYYPLIDYGNYSTNKIDYEIKTFRPALHVYEYMDKIIKGAGYTWESKFFQTDFFKRLIIPHSEATLKTTTSDLFKGDASLLVQGNSTAPITLQDNLNITKIYGDAFTTNDDKTFTYSGVSTKFIFNFNVPVYVWVYQNRGFEITVSILKNGVSTGVSQTAYGNGASNFNFIFTNAGVVFANTDTFAIEIVVDYYAGALIGTVYFAVANSVVNITSEYPITAPINIDDIVEVNKAIPKNILQKDFFASILKMFYLMVTEDKYKSNHLKIEPWTWFYDLNKSSYIDWSMKLDRSQPIRIRPMSEANARYYDIKYKSDIDYYNEFYKKKYNEGYGDVRYDNQLEFAKEASTTEVIFSATPLVGYPTKDKIVPSIFKWDGKVIGTLEESVNSNIRILQKKVITEVDEWDILDRGSILDSNTIYPYAGHFDDPDVPGSDINFGATKELFFSLSAGALGNNLFNTFYSSYLAEITDKDSRLVIAKFKLNDTDIFNLDFGKFIYLDGILYRLSKIVDYTPGEICTVELLRVIYTTYDNSVNASDDPDVTICGKIWKKKNFDGEFYKNGDPIPQITDDIEWSNATEGAWCYYDNNPANAEYGKLYNWYAINDPRGFGIEGYRVPTDNEWNDLSRCVDEDGYSLREIGTSHWDTANGTDLYAFTALGGGRRTTSGTFQSLKSDAYFWTSTDVSPSKAITYRLRDNDPTIIDSEQFKNFGFSVRLIKE